jgi:hypothetical protein
MIYSIQVCPVYDTGTDFEALLWDDPRADRWGVYERTDGGLAEHVADYCCPVAALAAAAILSSKYGVPIERGVPPVSALEAFEHG